MIDFDMDADRSHSQPPTDVERHLTLGTIEIYHIEKRAVQEDGSHSIHELKHDTLHDSVIRVRERGIFNGAYAQARRDRCISRLQFGFERHGV